MNKPTMTGDAITVEPWLGRQRPGALRSIIAPFSADKSLTHRAMMLAAMAQGCSVIYNPLEGEDCVATREAFKSLGVRVDVLQDQGQTRWKIDSPGIDGWRKHTKIPVLDLGNSGTSARLMTGLFAGVPGLAVTITGDDSLRGRPMGRVVEPLRCMGADISGERDGERLPLTITGKQLRGRTLGLQVPSAQVKSAILLAAASADGATVVSLPDGSRDHTERMLQNLGANLTVTKRFGQESIKMIGPWRPKPFVYDVPGDPSSAAFFAALAALHPGLTVHCPKLLLNPTRVGFFRVLERMGCSVTWDLKPSESRENRLGEVVGDVVISRSENQKLTGVHVHQNEIAKLIDEVPILAVVCSAAAGESVLEGLAELRVKESDRFARILALLSAAGITATAEGDRLCITGGQRPEGFEFNSHDHRMVMSACILATIGRTPSRIYGAQWIQTSFPLFLPALQNIKAEQL